MPQTGIRIQVKNFDKLMKQVSSLNETGRRALSSTVKDVKVRAPSWIASEVVNVYNIKKSEITPSSGKGAKPKKTAGSIRVKGETIEEITVTYEGRMLTPVHFGMTPKSPPVGKGYTLQMSVLKGKKKVIGRALATRTKGGPYSEQSHNILMGTGNAKEGGVNWIPFQRMSKRREDLQKFTTISVPQMVASELTNEKIVEKLQVETAKRLKHNLDRAMGKK